ncbi:Isochorismatase-like protein [Mycena vitilis]|nr:Isochorismatase-like protein [Mycena vitilis]
MASTTKDTAIVLIDPYNDFLHPDGKATPRLADSLAKTDTIANIKALLAFARAQKIPVYYGLHQQFHPGQYDDWRHMTTSQTALRDGKVFEEGSWGAQIYEGLEPDFANGDVVVSTDATAGFTNEAKEAAATLIWPLFANEVTTVEGWIAKKKQEGI